MANYDLKHFDARLASTKEWLQKEFKTLRTGRANPSILDSVSVNAYGSSMPLKQVASIGIEDPRTIRVQPFDSSLVKDIERGISEANLGLGTVPDQTGIRVSFPELTGERRQELIKAAKTKLEEARTAIRVARDEVWKDVQEKERLGTLTEDDKFSLKESLQKNVDKVNEELEKAFETKEQEMTS